MRVLALALLTVLLPAAASAGTDIAATCYQTCADSTHSTPEYKACVARAADKADQLLNESYKKLQDARQRRRQGHATKPWRPAWLSQGCAEAMDRLSRFRLHLRRQPRLRRHVDRQQLFIMSLRALL